MLLVVEQRNGVIDLVPWPPSDAVLLGMLDLARQETALADGPEMDE